MKAGSWTGDGLVVAESFFERLRGMKLSTVVRGVVIRRSAVHTLGLSSAIEIVAVDREGRVIGARTLAPNRFAWLRGASYLIELPGGAELPEVGSEVVVDDVG